MVLRVVTKLPYELPVVRRNQQADLFEGGAAVDGQREAVSAVGDRQIPVWVAARAHRRDGDVNVGVVLAKRVTSASYAAAVIPSSRWTRGLSQSASESAPASRGATRYGLPPGQRRPPPGSAWAIRAAPTEW